MESSVFGNAKIIYVTIEKPLKLQIFKAGGTRPDSCGKSHEGQKLSQGSLVMQRGISHRDDHELFLMKDMGANASHYPLHVRVHNDDGADDGREDSISERTVDEVSSTLHTQSLKPSSKIPSSLIQNIRRSAEPRTTTPPESTAPPCRHHFISPVS